MPVGGGCLRGTVTSRSSSIRWYWSSLPRRTAEWVQCHRPASLEEAVRLAEDHMAPIPKADEPSLSLSPSPVSSPVFLPSSLSLCSLPRVRSCPPQARRIHETNFPALGEPAYPFPVLQPLSSSGGGAHQHGCGRGTWAGLLEVRRPGPLPGSVSADGNRDGGAGLRCPAGCPRSGWSVPYSAVEDCLEAMMDNQPHLTPSLQAFFNMMLQNATEDIDDKDGIRFRTDGNFFNLRSLPALWS
ncbi:uncharacterized protein LOC127622253 [Xyrauchen texanus]|uniref:uncharacterized protein LOC127622253 n=1 Tax=Xyrauchen texanus TaxID=154827 RepID=UPI0022424CE8|nr:uncharacterized protein LOC127622253 [Xyrauchen texanus]